MEKYRFTNTQKNIAYYLCDYEIIWFTMYKRPIIENEMILTIRGLIKEITEMQIGIELKSCYIESNCVVLALSISPTITIHNAICLYKKELASKLGALYPNLKKRVPCIWSSGYLINTIGQNQSKNDIKSYSEMLPNSRIQKLQT